MHRHAGGAWGGDEHDQNKWMSPLMRQLKVTYKVKPLFAQL